MTVKEFEAYIRANAPDRYDDIFFTTDLRLPAGVKVRRSDEQIQRWLDAALFDPPRLPTEGAKPMPDEKKPEPEPNVEFNPPIGTPWPGEPPTGVPEAMAQMHTATEESERARAMPFMRGGLVGMGAARIKRMNAVEPMSAYEQLIERREKLKVEMQQTEEAIKALEANPEIERVMRLVGRALY